jgi:hypothetical protein
MPVTCARYTHAVSPDLACRTRSGLEAIRLASVAAVDRREHQRAGMPCPTPWR